MGDKEPRSGRIQNSYPNVDRCGTCSTHFCISTLILSCDYLLLSIVGSDKLRTNRKSVWIVSKWARNLSRFLVVTFHHSSRRVDEMIQPNEDVKAQTELITTEEHFEDSLQGHVLVWNSNKFFSSLSNSLFEVRSVPPWARREESSEGKRVRLFKSRTLCKVLEFIRHSSSLNYGDLPLSVLRGKAENLNLCCRWFGIGGFLKRPQMLRKEVPVKVVDATAPRCLDWLFKWQNLSRIFIKVM